MYLTNVKKIYLSHNNISDILVVDENSTVVSVFHHCKNLREMDLSFNKINRIFSDWTVKPYPFFETLNLSYNQIERIHVCNFFILIP